MRIGEFSLILWRLLTKVESRHDLSNMAYTGKSPASKASRWAECGHLEEYRREELIRIIEHSVENLTLQEIEALYYDMVTKNFINE